MQGRLHRTDVLGPGAAAVPTQALQRFTGRVHRYCFGLVRISHVRSGITWEKEQLAHVLTSLFPCCLVREISSLEQPPSSSPVSTSAFPAALGEPRWAGPVGSGAVPAPGGSACATFVPTGEGMDIRLGWDLINPN